MANKNDDDALDGFFRAARLHAPVPSEALMTRILNDAAHAQRVQAHVSYAPSLWSRLSDALGGRPGLGGLATAAAVGLWLGYAGLGDPAGYVAEYWGAEGAYDLMPGAEAFVFSAAVEG